MRFSEQKNNELREKVRILMVRNPNVAISELQICLSKDYAGRIFDKNYIAKLKNKIHKEWTVGFRSTDLIAELARFEDLVLCARKELIAVVFNDSGEERAKDIVSAFRAVIWAQGLLVASKLNAGIYKQGPAEKKATTLTPEQDQLISQAIEFALGDKEL